MAFRFNISEKSGKTYKIETEAPALIGKELGDTIRGIEISPDLEGYEFEICGGSDKAGIPMLNQIDGFGLKRVLLSYEKGMKKRPKKELKKKRSKNKPKGLRLRKTVRGKSISENILQLNLKVLKEGAKKLSDMFGKKEGEEKPEEKEAKKSKKEAKEEK